MASVKAITLNEEQTRKFLSFFVKEALEIAKKELENEKSSVAVGSSGS